jgi:chemosensory pili system protein ChpA (sensor histidine kinase/response regulator)
MDGETSYSTIHWIRAEVDVTLNQARQALEAYVEHPEDNSHLRQCTACLQQVRGTLQIVELMGGAELAQEMERLADFIGVDEQRRQPEVYDLLMRAILVLTNYLEWIREGHDDLPLALISSINEIRSVRGVEPLAEAALFAPDLSCVPADLSLSSDRDEISSLAWRIRPLYESALVEWLLQRDERISLMRMARAIKQLEQSSTLPKTARIWWIVGGIIEALLDQGLEPTLSLKQALGHVDGLIKTLGESGDEGLAHALSDEFTKGLLYLVAKASSRGIKVMGVKEAFKLDSILPREHLLEEIRLSLSAPTAQLWESVAPALLEDLTRVKDMLDVFARQGGWTLEGLQPIEDTLQRLGHTLEMLGLNRIRQLILEQLGRLQAMVGRDPSCAASDLTSLANDLLYAELLIKRAIETDHRSSLEEGVIEEDPELLTAVIRGLPDLPWERLHVGVRPCWKAPYVVAKTRVITGNTEEP